MRMGRWFVLAAALALIALRAPRLLLRPRLWAEEGSDFFAHAWHSSFLAGVFFVQPDGGGYFNLAASLPECLYLEFSDLAWNRLASEPVQFADGHAIAPDRPGHGITLDRDALAEYSEPG